MATFQRVERRAFVGDMNITGRISVSPGPDWNEIRMQSLSTEDMREVLDQVKLEQRTNAVVDTLAALVYDVNATAEVLRRGSLKRRKKPEPEVKYHLRITPQPDDGIPILFPSPKPTEVPNDNVCTMEQVNSEYGVNLIEETNIKKRARSETPRHMLQIESTPPPKSVFICAFCNEDIDLGAPCITALAPNSPRAQKFHPHHFCCMYCLKALNVRGTYREVARID